MSCQCPYCKKDMDDPDDAYETGTRYEQQCPHCEKTFSFEVEYERSYSTYQAPCLNDGGEHDWKFVKGYPEEYFKGRQRCSYCQEERTNKEVTEG